MQCSFLINEFAYQCMSLTLNGQGHLEYDLMLLQLLCVDAVTCSSCATLPHDHAAVLAASCLPAAPDSAPGLSKILWLFGACFGNTLAVLQSLMVLHEVLPLLMSCAPCEGSVAAASTMS